MIEQIAYYIYSYSVYIVSGNIFYILIVSLISNRVAKRKCNIKVLDAILFISTVLIPLCNCFAITYVLFKKININDKKIIIYYLSATFFKISGLLMIYIFFDIFVLLIWIIVFIVLLLISCIIYNLFINKTIEMVRFRTIKDMANDIIEFNSYYLIGMMLMLIVSYMIPYEYYLYLLNKVRELNFIDITCMIATKYICFPSDIKSFVELCAQGLNAKYLFYYIIVGTLLNIQELILLNIYVRKKHLFIVYTFIITFVFLFTLIILNISQNKYIIFDLSMAERFDYIINLLNVMFNNLIRIISGIVLIVSLFIFIFIKIKYIKKLLRSKL